MNDLYQYIDKDFFLSLVDEYKNKHQELIKETIDFGEYSPKLYELKFYQLFEVENNDIVDGEFQYLRFNFIKKVLSNIKNVELKIGLAGFDLSYSRDSINHMIILIDKRKDLDEEFIAMIYQKFSYYLKSHPTDFCSVAELFTSENGIYQWKNEKDELENNMNWMSLDQLLVELCGTNILPMIIENIQIN